MDIPGVAICYTAQKFSLQATCSLRIRRKYEGRTHAVVAKVRCRVGRAVARPGPSPDPDERISRIRLFR
jgi:hypothetical protein